MSIEKTTRLVARFLGVTPEALAAGFRPARPDEFDAVLSLRREILQRQLVWDDAAYLRWRYQFGAPGVHHLATCWVVTRGHEVLGMIGVEALTARAGAETSTVHAVMDLMVRPDLEGGGLGVWINQAVCQRLGCVLAIGSNPNSRGVVSRTFEPLPDRRSLTHPLHFRHFMAKRLPHAGLARPASIAAGGLMIVFRVVMLWLASLGAAVAEVQELGAAEALLLARAQRADRVDLLRDVGGLTHRLLRNPRSPAVIWTARRHGEVVGLMAVRRTAIEDGRHALQVMDIVLAPGQEGRTLRALLARVTARGFRDGADYLSITHCDPMLEAELRKVFFRHQPHPYETLAWSCPEGPFKEAVMARRAWSLFDIHTDRDQS